MSVNKPSDPPEELPTVSFTQLRVFKGLSVVLAILFLGLVGLFLYKQRQMQPVAVLVNGNPVAVAFNYFAATTALTSLKRAHGFGDSNDPQITEQITYTRIPDNQPTQVDPDDTLRAKVAAAVHVTVKGAVITIDKKPILGLPTDDMASQTLDAVKQHYAQAPPNDPLVSDPTFRETVTVVDERIPIEMTCPTVADATTFLITPPPAKTYVVQNHETGWSIARKFHIPFGKFLIRNAGSNINRLRIGDTVNLYGGAPPITVVVTKRSQSVEPIRSGVPASAAGSRRLDIETTYINGNPTGAPLTMGVTTLQRAAPSRSLM